MLLQIMPDSGASDTKWVLMDGARYVTLPWYLGSQTVQSEKQTCASSDRVDLRNVDSNTLLSYWGQEILGEDQAASVGEYLVHTV